MLGISHGCAPFAPSRTWFENHTNLSEPKVHQLPLHHRLFAQKYPSRMRSNPLLVTTDRAWEGAAVSRGWSEQFMRSGRKAPSGMLPGRGLP